MEICLKVNEYILEIVTDMSLLATCEDNFPFPSLKSLDQVKESYEQNIVEFMILNKLDKGNIENFGATPTINCTRIKEVVKFIKNMLRES